MFLARPEVYIFLFLKSLSSTPAPLNPGVPGLSNRLPWTGSVGPLKAIELLMRMQLLDREQDAQDLALRESPLPIPSAALPRVQAETGKVSTSKRNRAHA
jgi:hypothetical protein